MNEKHDLDKLNFSLSAAKMSITDAGISPFLATIIYSMPTSWETNLPTKTAATDGTNLYLDPDFWLNLNKVERVTLLAHEAWHVALKHMTRLENRDPKQWNIAGDYVINYLLTNQKDKKGNKVFSLPKGGLYNSKYNNSWTTENVYDDLANNPPKDDALDSGFGEDLIQVDPNDPKQKQQANDIDLLIQKAAVAEKSINGDWGNLPADCVRHIEEMFNPSIPWQKLLADCLLSTDTTDYTFRKPNKRFFGTGSTPIIMPSLYGEALGKVNIYIDVSGSVTDPMIKLFRSEMIHLMNQMRPEEINVTTWSTRLENTDTYTRGEDMSEWVALGTGGTNIGPVLEHIVDSNPEISIIFTDGYFSRVDQNDKYKEEIKGRVIWLIDSNPNWETPLGKVIHHEL